MYFGAGPHAAARAAQVPQELAEAALAADQGPRHDDARDGGARPLLVAEALGPVPQLEARARARRQVVEDGGCAHAHAIGHHYGLVRAGDLGDDEVDHFCFVAVFLMYSFDYMSTFSRRRRSTLWYV